MYVLTTAAIIERLEFWKPARRHPLILEKGAEAAGEDDDAGKGNESGASGRGDGNWQGGPSHWEGRLRRAPTQQGGTRGALKSMHPVLHEHVRIIVGPLGAHMLSTARLNTGVKTCSTLVQPPSLRPPLLCPRCAEGWKQAKGTR